ncbi:FkbM family methyltransferase [Brevibacillus sp. 179-C9.3 HS]|uniref:FkbM family methyltransferase n=1 Tax=unclassified Brevibacillus TaxID=2684853 RepID=UPI0039A21778
MGVLNENTEEVFASISYGDIAIDCGANMGIISQKMADKGALVFAFEPNPFVFEELLKRVGSYPNVVCINKAVWHKNDKLRLHLHDLYHTDPAGSAYASSLLTNHPVTDIQKYVEVEVIDLTQFIQMLNRPIKLIKIDIEGAEFELLEKIVEHNLHLQIDKIVVENHEWLIADLKAKADHFRRVMQEKQIHNIDLNWV